MRQLRGVQGTHRRRQSGQSALRVFFALVSFLFLMATFVRAQQKAEPPPIGTPLPLSKCLEIALEKNHRRPLSQFAVAMAEAQHRQALAGYWPQVNGTASLQHRDQPINFIFPSGQFGIPSQSVSVPGGTMLVTVPANAFAPGFPPAALQLPVSFPGQTVTTAAQVFATPEQNVKVLDRNLALGSLDVKWLLFDGGMRRGYREQAAGQVDMMRQEARRTDLEIVDSVKRMYWGAVLAHQLLQLGQDTLARMEVTLKLTESLYKEGAGKVTKADYLDSTVMVESVRAMVAHLEKNEKMAQAALANTMGLEWSASVQPASEEIPFEARNLNLEGLVGDSYRFNPDWNKLEAGLRAAEGAVRTARSGYFPKLALTGEINRWWNNGYSMGLASPQNLTNWTAGVGVEIPVFDGFLTQNRVKEALFRVQTLKKTQFLLREGLGLQVKDTVLGLDAAIKADEATSRAVKAAADNRDLNTRAYEAGIVETDKVIRAHLVEALMIAHHYMARYQYTALLSQLNLIVGREVQAALQLQP